MNTQPRLHVLLIDDHAVVRQGLQMLLEREGEYVVSREAATLHEAVAPGEDPDVILTDLILVETQGRELIEALRNRYPKPPILVLSMVDDPAKVRAALGAGANGYLLKESAAEDLIQAMGRVARGEGYLQPSLGAALAREVQLRNPAGLPIALTDRELDVLHLLALGHTNRQIAGSLKISTRTVEANRAALLRIVGVTSRAELVRFALDARLVQFTHTE
jgi:two-component system, NarL family, response regulator NreC